MIVNKLDVSVRYQKHDIIFFRYIIQDNIDKQVLLFDRILFHPDAPSPWRTVMVTMNIGTTSSSKVLRKLLGQSSSTDISE